MYWFLDICSHRHICVLYVAVSNLCSIALSISRLRLLWLLFCTIFSKLLIIFLCVLLYTLPFPYKFYYFAGIEGFSLLAIFPSYVSTFFWCCCGFHFSGLLGQSMLLLLIKYISYCCFFFTFNLLYYVAFYSRIRSSWISILQIRGLWSSSYDAIFSLYLFH